MAHLHHIRGNGLDHALFGICADIAINQGLTHLPSFAIDHQTYSQPAGLAAEAYYARLDQERKANGDKSAPGTTEGGTNDEQSPDGNPQDNSTDPSSPKGLGNGPGEESSQPGAGQPESGAPAVTQCEATCDNSSWKDLAGREKRYERRVAALAKEALQKAKQAGMPPGRIPAELTQLIESTGRKARDWRRELQAFARKHAPQGLRGTILRCSRRGDPDQPGLRLQLRSTFVVFVDTSGSVTSEQLEQFFAELNRMVWWADIVVMEVDARIQRIYRHRRGTPSIEFQGRGGTYFSEAFDAMAGRCKRVIPGLHLLRRIAAVIILTDGGIFDVPPKNPMPYDVMWALTPGASPPRDWGAVIHLDADEPGGR